MKKSQVIIVEPKIGFLTLFPTFNFIADFR